MDRGDPLGVVEGRPSVPSAPINALIATYAGLPERMNAVRKRGHEKQVRNR